MDIRIYTVFCLYAFFAGAKTTGYDVVVVGPLNNSGSYARVSMVLLDLYGPAFKTTYLPTQSTFTQHPLVKIVHKKRTDLGKPVDYSVAILTDLPDMKERHNFEKVPSRAQIKIAITTVESTAIPHSWVDILNKQFDAVLTHDDYFANAFRTSGVTIPVFVLPLPVYLDELFALPRKNTPSTPFTFGSIAENWPRKNLPLLIQGFDLAFHNNDKVRLLIHSKKGLERDQLQKIIDETGSNNIALTIDVKNWHDYVQLFSTFDCYVLISKGEGYSITPREALAAGIPCILSNNSAHITICKTGFVHPLETPIVEPAYYSVYDEVCGQWYTCTPQAVAQALTQVYTNYDTHLKRAQHAQSWCRQFTLENLRTRYLNLVRPPQIIVGTVNEIRDGALVTTSPELARKYQALKRSIQHPTQPGVAVGEDMARKYQALKPIARAGRNAGLNGSTIGVASKIIHR